MTQEIYDVAIIGSGLAGLTAATLLHQQGFSVTIVDNGVLNYYHTNESLLLDPELIALFDRMGIYEDFIKCLKPKANICFSNFNGKQKTLVEMHSEQSNSTRFVLLNRVRLTNLLLDKLIQAGVSYYTNFFVRKIDFIDNKIQFEDQYSKIGVIADFIIDASGESAIVAKQLGLKLDAEQIVNYFSLVKKYEFPNIKHKLPYDLSLTEINQGYIFVAPLDDNNFSVGLTLSENVLLKNIFDKSHLFDFYVEKMQWLTDVMCSEKRTMPVIKKRHFTYNCKVAHDQKCFLIGDAVGLDDPCYSAGIRNAFDTAELACSSIKKILNKELEIKVVIKNYSEQIQLIKKVNKQKTLDWLNKKSPSLNGFGLTDPHNFYPISNFLLGSHLSQDSSLDCSTLLQNARARFGEILFD